MTSTKRVKAKLWLIACGDEIGTAMYVNRDEASKAALEYSWDDETWEPLPCTITYEVPSKRV